MRDAERMGGASATFVDGYHVDVMQRGGDHSCHPRVERRGGDDESRMRRRRMGEGWAEMEGRWKECGRVGNDSRGCITSSEFAR